MRNACRPVGAGHRRVDEMCDADCRRRAKNVDALASFRFYSALVRRGHGEDGIDATRGALEASFIIEVAWNDRDASFRERRGGRRLRLPRQCANRMPAREQLAHEMSALFPCRARHEHAFRNRAHGWTHDAKPRSRRSDSMTQKVVLAVKTSAAASTPVYFLITGAAAASVHASR